MRCARRHVFFNCFMILWPQRGKKTTKRTTKEKRVRAREREREKRCIYTYTETIISNWFESFICYQYQRWIWVAAPTSRSTSNGSLRQLQAVGFGAIGLDLIGVDQAWKRAGCIPIIVSGRSSTEVDRRRCRVQLKRAHVFPKFSLNEGVITNSEWYLRNDNKDDNKKKYIFKKVNNNREGKKSQKTGSNACSSE